jgi:hypothetical protein
MRTTTLCALALLFVAPGGPATATDPDIHGLRQIFVDLEVALKAASEPAFKRRWHPLGYAKNLVGGSGLAGHQVFTQGSTKHWALRPEMKTLRGVTRGEPWILRCDVWSWDQRRPVDSVWALVATHEGVGKVIGAGEVLADVEALAHRWADNKPLEPPKPKRPGGPDTPQRPLGPKLPVGPPGPDGPGR